MKATNDSNKNEPVRPPEGLAVTSSALDAKARRASFLAEVVPAATMVKLKEAHSHFFGVLSDPGIDLVEKTVVASFALTKLKSALKGDILENVIMPLMNTPTGFDTDKNPAKGWRGDQYDESVVLECVAQAWLQGLPVVGNCWNIIAGSMYPRKEGFELLVGSVCSYRVNVSVPAIGQELFDNGGYLKVPVSIHYRLHSDSEDVAAREMKSIYSVRLNKRNAVAVENTEGKAKRKALRDLWSSLSGTYLPDADGDYGEGEVHQVGAHFGEEGAQESADSVEDGAGK